MRGLDEKCTVQSRFKDFFQICVVIQMNQESKLTDNDKEAVHAFLIEEIDRDVEERELSFVESVLFEAESQQKREIKYQNIVLQLTLSQCLQFVNRLIRFQNIL